MNIGILTLTQMTILDDGGVLTFNSVMVDDERISGMQRIGPEGPEGDLIEPPKIDFEPVTFSVRTANRSGFNSSAYFPSVSSAFAPSGDQIIGVSDRYRVEVHHRDGRRTVIERDVSPTPVHPAEAEAERRRLMEWARDIDPEWRWTQPDIPTTRPAFDAIHVSYSGEVWVRRSGESVREPECDPEEPWICWTTPISYDVFADGKFMGSVQAPPGLHSWVMPHIDGDVFIGVVTDDLGTAYVKRYRLEVPGGAT